LSARGADLCGRTINHSCWSHACSDTSTDAPIPAQNLDGAWKKQQEFDAVRAAWLKTVQMQQQQQPLPPDAMQAQQQQQQQVAMAQQLYPDAGACLN